MQETEVTNIQETGIAILKPKHGFGSVRFKSIENGGETVMCFYVLILYCINSLAADVSSCLKYRLIMSVPM